MTEAPLEIAERFREYALEELSVARNTHSDQDQTAHHVVAYLCQQSVEKVIKALLYANHEVPPKTHDLRFLSELAEEYLPDPEILAEADSLNPYASETRYPEGSERVSQEKADRALELAIEIVWEISDLLAEEDYLDLTD